MLDFDRFEVSKNPIFILNRHGDLKIVRFVLVALRAAYPAN